MGLIPIDPPPIAETERYVKLERYSGAACRPISLYGGYAVKVAAAAARSLAPYTASR